MHGSRSGPPLTISGLSFGLGLYHLFIKSCMAVCLSVILSRFWFLAITPVCDLIETWGFRVDDPCDFPDIHISPHKKVSKPNIMQPLKTGDFSQFFGHNSSLGLNRDLGFSHG